MLLSTKHQNEQTVIHGKFTGGLNLSTVAEMIADDQLAEAVNVECDKATGALKTCCGTALWFQMPPSYTITSLIYDSINLCYLVVCGRKVFRSHLVDMTGNSSFDRQNIGDLTGDLMPITTPWEDGALIASGGKLQYYNGYKLLTIKKSFADDNAMWKKVDISAYKAERFYKVNDIVIDGEKYYICKKEHTSSDLETDKENWIELNLIEWEFTTSYTEKNLVKVDDVYYLCTSGHVSVTDSPDICSGVYVGFGRVFVYYGNTIKYSAIGDETDWKEDNNVDSAAKFIEPGYKDGGNILGIVNLGNDILIVKDNQRVYRLSGDYPNWVIREVSRNITCLNRNSFCAITGSVFVLGDNTLQMISPTQEYGDLQAQNIAQNIVNLLYQTNHESKMYFVASLNQIWILGMEDIIIYDISFQAFFLRRFSKPVKGLCMADGRVLLVRERSITELSEGIYQDFQFSLSPGEMEWLFKTRRLVSAYEYLLKRSVVSYIPLSESGSGQIMCGKVVSPLDFTPATIQENIFPIASRRSEVRQIYRSQEIDVEGRGRGSAIMLNQIGMNLAEV